MSFPFPTLIASTTAGPAPLTVQFNAVTNGNPDTYEWRTVAGVFSTSSSATLTFSKPGTFRVDLKVTYTDSPDGLTGTYIQVSGDQVTQPATEASSAASSSESSGSSGSSGPTTDLAAPAGMWKEYTNADTFKR